MEVSYVRKWVGTVVAWVVAERELKVLISAFGDFIAMAMVTFKV